MNAKWSFKYPQVSISKIHLSIPDTKVDINSILKWWSVLYSFRLVLDLNLYLLFSFWSKSL